MKEEDQKNQIDIPTELTGFFDLLAMFDYQDHKKSVSDNPSVSENRDVLSESDKRDSE